MSNTATRAWVLPDEPTPVRLMNTIWADGDGIHDDLSAAADVDDWLDAVRIERGDGIADREELLLATRLRDALRRLASVVTSDDRLAAASPMPTKSAIREINAVAAKAPGRVLTVEDGRLELGTHSSVSPVTAGLAHVAQAAMTLLAGEDATMLRACHAPGCVLYFVGTHPRRQWCSVACGNRERAARHYERTKTAKRSR